MTAAPRIEITAPLSARAAFLTDAYSDMTAAPETLLERLQPLRNLRGHSVVDEWESLLSAGDFNTLATQLMDAHYDPSYARSRGSHTHQMLGSVTVETLDNAGQEQAAEAIAALVNRAPQ